MDNKNTATPARLCACGCGADLSALRADALYASESCRKRVERSNSADKGRTRRQSREGKGAHLYLTPGELNLLTSALARLELPPTFATQKFRGKLVRAIQRSQARVGSAK